MKQYSKQQIKYISDNFQQGQRAIQLGQLSRAEKCYIDILKIGPDIIEARNALAFVYSVSKQYLKAADQLQITLKSYPNDANIHHNLANTLSELDDYEQALLHYQTAINLNPSFVDSYTQCGVAYHKLKKHESAIQCFHQALNLDKANGKIHHLLAKTYSDIQHYPQAVDSVLNATDLEPNNMEFQLSFANILRKAGRTYEADVQYHQICNRFPNYLDAFLAYGDYLIENKFFNEALECFKHAKQLAPNDVDILDDLGTCYLGLANAEAAIQFFNEALIMDQNRLTSLVGVEQAYQDTGKLEQAINLCDQIISLDTKNPTGYILKSKVRKSTLNDGLSEHLLRLSSQNNLSDEERISINFSLGKVYDDQENYSQAFKYYAAGNVIRNDNASYDRAATEAHYSELTDFFNADFFKKDQHLSHENNLPIMIIGMPRSGTTLTEQIISSHPQVAGAGEVKFWSMVLNSMSSVLDTPLTYPKCLVKMQKQHASSIVSNYEATLYKTAGVKTKPSHITDKMPHNFLCIGLIAKLFPNIKIIHTKRNPVDTCLSIFFQNFNDAHPYAYNLSDLGHYYQQYERLMRHWHEVLPGRIMDINYSDTVSDPEYWSRALISNIGLAWDDSCLAPHKLERSVKTASHWQVRQPIYKSSLERWKHYEGYIQPLISALNYRHAAPN